MVEVEFIQKLFDGRVIDVQQGMEPAEMPAPSRAPQKTANEAPDVPVMKMFRCMGENPGCGIAKPANAFYQEIKDLCSECVLKLAHKHQIDIYWVPLAVNCYHITRKIRDEAHALATSAGRDAGYTKLVVNKEIEKGRNHFVKSMVEGTKKDPLNQEWVMDLYGRYRGWIMKAFEVPAEKYSNLPKNNLLS